MHAIMEDRRSRKTIATKARRTIEPKTAPSMTAVLLVCESATLRAAVGEVLGRGRVEAEKDETGVGGNSCRSRMV